jgi:hypothetical protein
MLIDWRAEQYESRTASLVEVQMKQLRTEAQQYMSEFGPKKEYELEDHKACLKQLRAFMVGLADMGFALATIEQGRDYFLAVVIANLPSLTSESIHECKGPIYRIWG